MEEMQEMETKGIASVAPATQAILSMRDVLANDGMMADGYKALADMPDLVTTLDRIVDRVVNGKAFTVGNANRDDIHSDAMQEVAAMLAMGETVSPGTVGKRVRRVAQRYAQRTVRALPIAMGNASEGGPSTDADGGDESSTNGSYWDDYRVTSYNGPRHSEADHLIKRAPRRMRTVVLADTYGKAPVPDNAYGSHYRPEMDAVTVGLLTRYYPKASKGSSLYDLAKDAGMVESVTRADALGTQTHDKAGNTVAKENGDLPGVLTLAASMATLHKRTARYTMGNELTPAQMVAIDAARSIGSIAPIVSHLQSKGDPTYMLAQSAPSAESEALRRTERIAEVAAAESTLYAMPYPFFGPGESFYVPLARYKQNTRDKEGLKLLHIRGTIKRDRYILLGDRVDKDSGKVTQKGLVSTFHPEIERRNTAMVKVGRTLRKAANAFRTERRRFAALLEWQTASDPFTIDNGPTVYRRLTVGSDGDGGCYHADPDGSPCASNSLTFENQQTNRLRRIVTDAAEKAARYAEIERLYARSLSEDPTNEYGMAFRKFIGSIRVGDWSYGLK